MDEISRMEKILRGDPIEPITRLEKFCAKAAGTYTGDPLTPVTRLEWFLDQISGGGGGGPMLSTLIAPNAYNSFTGDLHYKWVSRQQLEAPEGYAYDKVWIPDEYCTSLYFSNNASHVLSGSSGSLYRWYDLPWIESICLVGNPTKIYQHNFDSSVKFSKLAIYKSDAIVPLDSINAFSNTCFASGKTGGTLYVPSALISSYQSATNWSTILGYANNRIQAIEGSEFQA